MHLDQPQHRDVVDLLLDAHIEARQIVSMAESLSSGSATSGARETAITIADHVAWLMPMHNEDEDKSLAPRLMGRHHSVDYALDQMKLQHLALAGPMARVRMLCLILAGDISRLHALRFELGAAVKDLRERLAEHHDLEESVVFPALKQLLCTEELESIAAEMLARRAAAAA